MSLLNLIDGSYDTSAPIDIETLVIDIPTASGVIHLRFSKSGNICTLYLSSDIINTTAHTFTIQMIAPEITPFKPTASFTKDFQILVNNSTSWEELTWDIPSNMINITITNIAPTNIQLSQSDSIIYNVV